MSSEEKIEEPDLKFPNNITNNGKWLTRKINEFGLKNWLSHLNASTNTWNGTNDFEWWNKRTIKWLG